MLTCKEQQNPIKFRGREIKVSDKVLNAHYFLCNLPIDERVVGMHIGFALKGDEKNLEEKLKTFTDEQLTMIVEDGVKDEFFNLLDEETWNNIAE